MSTVRGGAWRLAVSAMLLALALSLWPAGRFHAQEPSPPPPPADVAPVWSAGAAGTLKTGARLIPAVVYEAGDGHIHELALKTAWQHTDLTAESGGPSPYDQIMAFRRGDGVSMIVYKGWDRHIHTIYLELVRQGNSWHEHWKWADLTAITGAPDAASEPYGYVRSDGIAAVVYGGYDEYHIHELWLDNGWHWADLTALSGAPIADGFRRPMPYVRGDGVNAVAYAALPSGHLCELRLEGGWKWADLTALAGAPRPSSGLAAYVRSDGISTINYARTDGHVYDLRLENGWRWADLTALSGAPGEGLIALQPSGYVRSDGINAVLYATAPSQGSLLYELRLDNGWRYYELTAVPNAARGYDPTGYVRADGISAVVYRSTDGHIQELRLGTTWQSADLTSLAAAPIAVADPWPYNRSTISSVYLPMIAR